LPSDHRTVLAFDTSAAYCAAVLLRDGAVAGLRDEPMGRGQAEALLPMLEGLLADAALTWPDIDAIAVCTGPGNFTGCRIGVAAARGLAFGSGVEAVGVSLFEALAAAIPGPAIACYTDRKGQIFAQAWVGGVPFGPPTRDLASILPDIPDGAICVGAGAARAAAILGRPSGPEPARADIVTIARRGAARAGRPGAVRPAPVYLRAADAAPASEPAPVLIDDA
jgi:tRNA threonylcarbamoyl adenosine modification protein YeaZ